MHQIFQIIFHFFIDNSQTTAIEEIESELSSEKVDYIQEIGLVSLKPG